MTQHTGVKWHCSNPNCPWSMVATIALPGERAPRCVCGNFMEKESTITSFGYLDFLRGEASADVGVKAQED